MEQRQEIEERMLNLEDRIFPMLDVKESRGNRPRVVGYIGTCFLTRMGQQHVFVTAKHLFSEKPNKHNLHLACYTPEKGSFILKVRAVVSNRVNQDISFFIPTPDMKAEYENLLVPMEWLRHKLPVGQNVLVFGFPNSGQQNKGSTMPLVDIKLTDYQGKVLRIEHDPPFSRVKTIYYLDFPAPGGLCGSPVMVEHNDTLKAAGYIIGEQTTDGKVVVAVSTDNTPFVVIEKLLIDLSNKFSSKRE